MKEHELKLAVKAWRKGHEAAAKERQEEVRRMSSEEKWTALGKLYAFGLAHGLAGKQEDEWANWTRLKRNVLNAK